jgi:hypothetical protein
METKARQEIAEALAQWQSECERLSDHARHLRQAMVAYADGVGDPPIEQLRELELRRGRADALGRDLLHLIKQSAFDGIRD